MKKLFAAIFLTVLLHNSVFPLNLASIKNAAVQKKEQFLHYWHCATSKKPEQYQCSAQTIARSRRWLAETSLVVLITILTAIGIKVNKDRLARIKNEQKQRAAQAFQKLQQEYNSLQDQITQAGRAKNLAVLYTVKELQRRQKAVLDRMSTEFPEYYNQWVNSPVTTGR